MEDIWPVLVGALAAIAGSLVTAFVGWLQNKSDRRRELLIDAYREYLTGLAERASLLHAHSERTEAATAKMVAGKQMIAAYAPSAVVKALAGLESSPMLLSDPETQTAMVALVSAMRRSTGNGATGLENEIRAILFSVDVVS